jgi:hypothetical protein
MNKLILLGLVLLGLCGCETPVRYVKIAEWDMELKLIKIYCGVVRTEILSEYLAFCADSGIKHTIRVSTNPEFYSNGWGVSDNLAFSKCSNGKELILASIYEFPNLYKRKDNSGDAYGIFSLWEDGNRVKDGKLVEVK